MRWLTPGTPGYRLWSLLAGWPRWVAAGCCATAALVLAVVSPATSPGSGGPVVDVLVAASDLPAGAVLSQGSVRVARWPTALRPAQALGSVAEVSGRRTGAPMARGEPITQLRMLDTAVSASLQPGDVAITVTLAQPSQASIIAAGNRVDLYATTSADPGGAAGLGSAGPAASILARDVLVIAVLPPTLTGAEGSVSSGPSLVVACDSAAAARLAGQAANPVLASLRPT